MKLQVQQQEQLKQNLIQERVKTLKDQMSQQELKKQEYYDEKARDAAILAARAAQMKAVDDEKAAMKAQERMQQFHFLKHQKETKGFGIA